MLARGALCLEGPWMNTLWTRWKMRHWTIIRAWYSPEALDRTYSGFMRQVRGFPAQASLLSMLKWAKQVPGISHSQFLCLSVLTFGGHFYSSLLAGLCPFVAPVANIHRTLYFWGHCFAIKNHSSIMKLIDPMSQWMTEGAIDLFCFISGWCHQFLFSRTRCHFEKMSLRLSWSVLSFFPCLNSFVLSLRPSLGTAGSRVWSGSRKWKAKINSLYPVRHSHLDIG